MKAMSHPNDLGRRTGEQETAGDCGFATDRAFGTTGGFASFSCSTDLLLTCSIRRRREAAMANRGDWIPLRPSASSGLAGASARSTRCARSRLRRRTSRPCARCAVTVAGSRTVHMQKRPTRWAGLLRIGATVRTLNEATPSNRMSRRSCTRQSRTSFASTA